MPSHITKDDTSSSPLQRQARRTLCCLRTIARHRRLRRRQATIDGFEGRALLLQDALIKAEYLTSLLTVEDEEQLKKQPRAELLYNLRSVVRTIDELLPYLRPGLRVLREIADAGVTGIRPNADGNQEIVKAMKGVDLVLFAQRQEGVDEYAREAAKVLMKAKAVIEADVRRAREDEHVRCTLYLCNSLRALLPGDSNQQWDVEILQNMQTLEVMIEGLPAAASENEEMVKVRKEVRAWKKSTGFKLGMFVKGMADMWEITSWEQSKIVKFSNECGVNTKVGNPLNNLARFIIEKMDRATCVRLMRHRDVRFMTTGTMRSILHVIRPDVVYTQADKIRHATQHFLRITPATNEDPGETESDLDESDLD